MPERAPRPDSVQISVGTIFTVPQYGTGIERTDIVLDIGRDDFFRSVQLDTDEEGRRFWKPYNAATAGSENVGQVVGQMTVKEMVESGRRGVEKDGMKFSGSIITRLRKNAAKGERTLFLRE